jgi:hypothetical protein
MMMIEQAHAIWTCGNCIIPDIVPPSLARRLDDDLAADFAATFCEGDFYSTRTKLFGRLLLCSPRA